VTSSATSFGRQVLASENETDPILFIDAAEVTWSPDGQQLAGQNVDEFAVFDLDHEVQAVIGAEGESPSWQRLAP